jgi:hypothetical protein
VRRPPPRLAEPPARYHGVLGAVLAELRAIRLLLQELASRRSTV